MPILGLLGTEQYATERFKNIRRSVFYQYPAGAAPLIGLLSMLDGEVLNDPEFFWYEDRYAELVENLEVNGTTSGIWYADSAGALGAALGTGAATKTAGTAYWIRLAGYDNIRGNDVLTLKVAVAAPSDRELQVRVFPTSAGVYRAFGTDHYIRVTPLNTLASVTNAYTDYTSLQVVVLGNANEQGQVGAFEGGYTIPTQVGNAAQIFRTNFTFTGTALKTGAKFDQTGPYKDKAKKFSMRHMIQMELQYLFGEYSKNLGSASQQPTYTTGGVLFYLRLWEVGKGNSVAGVISTYDPSTPATANGDDNKRIININGAITETAFDDYLERAFRFNNNTTNEKLVFCGSGFLNVLNKMVKSKLHMHSPVPIGDSYGMNVTQWVSPFGTIYFKTHPLFTNNAARRYNALWMDVQNMKYRYVEGRDTQLLKNRQPNSADYREDEWLTESGLELMFPESFMYMVGVTSYA